MTHRARRFALLLALPALLVAQGCASPDGGLWGGPTLRIESRESASYLQPDIRTRVFGSADRNTADVILSDIPAEDLRAWAEGDADASGFVAHIHMFLLPRAGRTPIDFKASNATITVALLSGGRYGMYRGGGFLLPDGAPTGASFGGRLKGATLSPASTTPGFTDRLGHSAAMSNFSAERDEALTETVIDRISGLGL